MVHTASIFSVKWSAFILKLLDPEDKRNRLHLHVGDPLLNHATSYLGTATTLQTGRSGARIPKEKRSEPEFKHSPPSSAEVKNEWSHTSTSPCLLYGVDREIVSFM